MTQLVVKGYLAGLRTQFLIESADGLSLRVAKDGELALPALEQATSLQLSCHGQQWFARCDSGQMRAMDGTVINGDLALFPPLMVTLESATLVFDHSVDPELRVQRVPPSETESFVTAVPSPFVADADSFADERTLVIERTVVLPKPALSAQVPAEVRLFTRPPRPPVPALLPVVLARHVPREDVGPAEGDAEARHDGPAHLLEEAAVSSSGPKRTSRHPRLEVVGYSAMAAVIVITAAVGMMRAAGAQAKLRADTPPLRGSTEARPAPLPAVVASATVAAPAVAAPSLQAILSPDSKRAADLYATGDWEGARREYEALAATPDANPAFALIARALARRSGKTEVRR